MTKALVLSVDSYNFTDETSSRSVDGFTVWFVNNYRENSPEARGVKPVKCSVRSDSDIGRKLIHVDLPAVCDLEVVVQPGAGNKLSATLSRLTVLAPLPLEKIFSAVPPAAPR